MDIIEQKVYSKEVIEFTAVANEYCAFTDRVNDYNGIQVLRFMQRILPLLYSKILALPVFEPVLEDNPEKYVTEADWQRVHDSIIVKLGEANDYLEVFDEAMDFSESAVSSGIAEDLADIYQDIKDYLVSYSIGTLEIMNEALWQCTENFNLYWGQTLVNTLRAIHSALKTPEKIGEQTDRPRSEAGDIDTSDWIISKRMEDEREADYE
ncbi:MAG: DUF5063 domain-containing protein [Marinilabiliaceae bacterium]|jgi:hypothetical protein|nr:DUF5063 domain-containing protein [Marinilabiliaceae bacterium]